ncbi:13575_t:CDS:2, partial [Dentiscutata erythropus]
KNQKQQDSWEDICEKVESWPSSSTGDKEESFENPLPQVEFESQFSVIDLKFYRRYEEYVDDVKKEDSEKYQKFKMWFNYFDAHARSYHNLFNDELGEGTYLFTSSWEGETVKIFIASDGFFSTVESKKALSIQVVFGHTTRIHRLNPKAHNNEAQLVLAWLS